jgi:folate-dependent phosphoribosylglycinamide formyltransferase PurN
MMRLVLFAPTRKSLYARIVAQRILVEPEIVLSAIVVRSIWSFHRFRAELRRDGPRLLGKIRTKLVLGESALSESDDKNTTEVERYAGDDLYEMARRHEIPFISAPDLNDTRVENKLANIAPHLIVFTGGGLIRSNILSIPSLGIMNCHSGILPRYRGMDVVEWPLLEGDAEQTQIGLTLHYMDRGVDTGPLLLQHHETLRAGDTIEAIRARLEPRMIELVLKGIRGLKSDTLEPTPQMVDEGKQYYVMHPRLKEIVERKLRGSI